MKYRGAVKRLIAALQGNLGLGGPGLDRVGLQALLHLIGPVLLGLTLLAIRARTKR